MDPGNSPSPGAAPTAPASIVTCPSCHNPLHVEPSMGLEGPCPICGYYLRLVSPPASGVPVAVAPPVATGEPLKPAPRQVPGGPARREVPAAREPVYRARHAGSQARGRRRKSRLRHFAYLASRFMASPGGKMACTAIIGLGILAVTFGFFKWDHRNRVRRLELQHPAPPIEATKQPEAGEERFKVDESQLQIPGVR